MGVTHETDVLLKSRRGEAWRGVALACHSGASPTAWCSVRSSTSSSCRLSRACRSTLPSGSSAGSQRSSSTASVRQRRDS